MPLIFVPTPLGNLGDITLRARDALAQADLIVAEDTRVTARLLSALEISGKRLWSYREQNAASVTEGILERAATERVVVVSDAGMPAISDPGRELIVAARAAGIAIDVLPGPSAFVGAAVLSGFALEPLIFRGFLPRAKGERDAALRSAAFATGVTIFYESPARIRDTLHALAKIASESRVFVLREYTKLHEQQVAGSPSEILAALPEPVRGEVALAIEGAPHVAPAATEAEENAAIDDGIALGLSSAEIAKRLSAGDRERRSSIYDRVAARKREREKG